VSTQLRLVDPPEPRTRPTKAGAKGTTNASSPTSAKAPNRPRRATSGRVRSASGSARRAASWGDWRLDAGTRRVGRAGVAAAREALEAALEQELRAS
jgi:hypothetical protein